MIDGRAGLNEIVRKSRRAGTRSVPALRMSSRHQLRDASVSFQVADGRMTAAAFAGSGW